MLCSHLLHLGCISSFFLAHALLVFLLRLSRDSSPLLARFAFPKHGVNRLISSLHASIAINWSLAVLLEDHSGPHSGVNSQPSLSQRTAPLGSDSAGSSACLFRFGRPVTHHERPLLLFSFSYFLYDTLYELLSWDIPSVLHHVTTLVGIVNVLVQDCSGTDLVAALLVAEISTPALHLRYFLVQYSKRAEALTKKVQAQSEAEGRNEAGTTNDGQEVQPRQEEKECLTARRVLGQKDHGEGAGIGEGSAPSTAAPSPVSRLSVLTTRDHSAQPVRSADEVRLRGPDQLEASSAIAAAARALSKYDFRRPLDAVEKAFFVIFLFARGVAAPCLVYACVTCRSTPVLVRMGSVGILIVSFFWMTLLLNGLMKRLAATSRAAASHAGLVHGSKTQYGVYSPGQTADIGRRR